MRRCLLLLGVVVAVAFASGCRHKNPNYQVLDGPLVWFDRFAEVHIGEIRNDGEWTRGKEDVANASVRFVQEVRELAVEYLRNGVTFNDVRLADEADEGQLLVRGTVTKFNPGSRSARLVTGLFFGSRNYGKGFVEIRFTCIEGGSGRRIMTGKCFSWVTGQGRDPLVYVHRIVAGALADMLVDQVPLE